MENWLPSLTTPRTTAAYDLVIDLPRMAMKNPQQCLVARDHLREDYIEDADALIAVSRPAPQTFG